VLRDGVVEKLIIELPTEALADEVAVQLQMAWFDGESWGKNEIKKQLDPDGYRSEISKAIESFKNRNHNEQKRHHHEVTEQYESQRNKVRQQVLRLKK
jgi:hypothetical protein